MAKVAVWAAATAALLAITGCASTDATSQGAAGASNTRQCFSASNVRNFRVVDSRTVNIRSGRNVFRLDLFATCPDLTWNNSMKLQTSGSQTICTGSGLGTSVITRGSTGRQRCPVQTVTLLTPEEVEALPARNRP